MTPEALVNHLNAATGLRHRVIVTYRFEAPMRKGKIGQAEGRVEAYVERLEDTGSNGKALAGRKLGTLVLHGGQIAEFDPLDTTPYIEALPVLAALNRR